MSIFIHTIKRIFRNKIQVFFILMFPLAFMTLGFLGSEPMVRVAVIDQDQTDLTKGLIRNLETKADMKTIREEEIENKLQNLKLDYVLLIKKGFTERLISGKLEGITSYSVEESNFSTSIHAFVNQWLSHAQMIAAGVKGNPEAFQHAFTEYDANGKLQLESTPVIDKGATKTKSLLGFLIISMLYTSMIVGLYILINKNNHTLYRTLTAPIGLKNYMIQTICSFLFVSFIQILFVMIMLKWVYGMYLGDAAISIFILLWLFSFVTVSFGVAISSSSKSVVQACLIGICLVAPMAMLGGAYFPLDYAPDIIQTLSQFTPVTWVLQGIDQLLYGQSIFSLGKEMLVILLFAVIFFLLGTLRKVDISK
ncbi:ABC transporter permease [Pseudoneobacillus sp. C159]